jgi:thymidylate synthase ThyX
MTKRKISARIVADSVSPQGHRITTFVLTYPRIIHAEVMTHRMFSRNAASSRAIPFKKMVEDIENDPFIPIAWQKDHKGMQGSEYITDQKVIDFKSGVWLQARNEAIKRAKELNSNLAKYKSIDDYEELEGTGVTKQLCNRLLEPFQWYTCLVTATEFDNFFELRAPKYKLIGLGGKPAKSRKEWLNKMQFSSALHPSQYPKSEEEWWTLSESGAEIHIQALAEAMWDAMNESTPKKLKIGDWHIPFGDRIKMSILDQQDISLKFPSLNSLNELKIRIATARCARLSYMTFDNEINYEKDIKLHDQLLESKHASAFEHCCKVLNEEEYINLGKIIPHSEKSYTFEKGWVDNIRGFISYRRILNI